jgi:hypothetical protein
MPNIRIKDIPTTASASSSTDFLALDGSANGTRRLNAYSPTFGGNLTVSGTGNSRDWTLVRNADASAGTTTQNSRPVALQGAYWTGSASANRVIYIQNTVSSTTPDYKLDIQNNAGTSMLTLSDSGNATLAGNLTVSGTGVGLTIAPSSGTASLILNGAAAGSSVNFAVTGTNKYTAEYVNGSDFFAIGRSGVAYDLALKSGNVLVGTTTDGGQKLQVNGNSGFLGHLEIPADKHIYMKQSNPLRWSSDGLSTGSVRADVYADSGGALYLRTNGSNTALTLDSSQNATFAGSALVKSFVTLAGATSGTSFLHWKETSVADRGVLGFEAGSSTLKYRSGGYSMATGTEVFSLTSGGNATFAGSLTTAAPSGGTAGAWKLGVRVAATTTLDTTQYLQVDIGGTLYKVALVTS